MSANERIDCMCNFFCHWFRSLLTTKEYGTITNVRREHIWVVNFESVLVSFPTRTDPRCNCQYSIDQGVKAWNYYHLQHKDSDMATRWLRWSVSYPPGVGIIKDPFVNLSVSKIFDLTKVPITIFESHSYLAGGVAAQLRRYQSNMNVIFNS